MRSFYLFYFTYPLEFIKYICTNVIFRINIHRLIPGWYSIICNRFFYLAVFKEGAVKNATESYWTPWDYANKSVFALEWEKADKFCPLQNAVLIRLLSKFKQKNSDSTKSGQNLLLKDELWYS